MKGFTYTETTCKILKKQGNVTLNWISKQLPDYSVVGFTCTYVSDTDMSHWIISVICQKNRTIEIKRK